MKKYCFLKLLVVCMLFSFTCKSKQKKNDKTWDELPDVTNLTDLKFTEFVPTLENPISNDKNVIYSPAFLFAWDKLKNELKTDIEGSPNNSSDFLLFTKSKSHMQALDSNEFSVRTERDVQQIRVSAFFNKTLPFKTKLQAFDSIIVFNGKQVATFGMYEFDYEIVNNTEILYYKSDDDFILKLIPKDREHEIVLIKGLTGYGTLEQALKEFDKKIAEGIKEKNLDAESWKYHFSEKDKFSIPRIKFNIETRYPNIENQTFLVNKTMSFTITEAYQRTGFILNENGAVVESVAIAKAADTSQFTKPHPKRMFFDKPFLIVVKHVGRSNPYFVMRVQDSELMEVIK